MTIRRRALTWILLISAVSCYPTTTIVLVRHAERPPGTDPDLLPEGQLRAGDLSRALERANVKAIFHTNFKRTKQTAESLAVKVAVSMTEVPYAGSGQETVHVADLIQRMNAFSGRTVLYVGHTTTVPAIIAALGITPAPTIPETAFNRFYVVTRRKGSTGLVEVTYGR